MIKQSKTARELVLECLLEITEEGQYSHIVLFNLLSKYQYLDKKERAFIKRTVDGTLEHLFEIDYIINQFSKVKTGKMKPVIRGIVRSAVYQIKYMDSIPDSAVCNEAVKLAVRRSFGGLKGFVNGLLRNIARNVRTVEFPAEDTLEGMSIRYSMPEWIIEQWTSQYGMQVVQQMLKDFQEEKPTVIRCNLNRNTVEELIQKLEEEQVTVNRHPYLPYALKISGYDYLNSLQSFEEGDFYVQDSSSMLVAEAADPREGNYVIDVCAAPGGKALHIAEKLNGSGKVEARDLTDRKVGLISENIERFGSSNVKAVCQDALIPDGNVREKADIVLADLPCSGLGILGKKPDLKYRIRPASLKELASLQRQILSVVKDYVKPGGTLIYSTCTISREENEENVRWLLEECPEFRLADIKSCLPDDLKDEVKKVGCIQLLPGTHDSDGFFIAKFRKFKSCDN